MFPLRYSKLARNSGLAEDREPKGRFNLIADRYLCFLVCVCGECSFEIVYVCDDVRAVAVIIPS